MKSTNGRTMSLFSLAALTLGLSSLAHANDWPVWRGPTFNGIAADGQSVPTQWSRAKHVVWKVDVPGRGHSSPIVVGQRIVLTTADESRQTQSVVCFDRATGRQLWQTVVNEGGLPEEIHKKNTHASPTPSSNGTHVFAAFNNHDAVQLACLTLDGKTVWKRTVGAYKPSKYRFGYAPSPLLYKSTVIVSSETENEAYLVAVDQATGKDIWRTPRPRAVSYSSPIVAHVAGREQLLLSGGDQVSSYDPTNGRPLWTTQAIAPATCGTIVWDGDMVYASGGYPKKQTAGIRADGSGRVIWSNTEKCYEQSMLVHGGYLYAFTDNGIVFCWRALDGKEMWSERLRGPVSASPIFAGGHIYAANERGTTYVFKADPRGFELVAENELGDESFASPTICGNRIYLRVAEGRGASRQETLYCIGR